ncbi:MAG: hypothetical protein AAFQ98_07920 [Bacteroidota bacterium]
MRPPPQKNEVLVVGMIHSGHRTAEEYNLDVLRDLIQQINPDVILTEIPPDRFPTAWEEYQAHDTITEPRVRVFPEYADVIFPLTKTMDFSIVPTAGWTRPMADDRRAKLQAIRDDSTRADEWAEYQAANQLADSLMEATGRRNDPYFIHTPTYDSIYEIRLATYNRLFNEELGLGGWDIINAAHYGYIAKALDEYAGQGKRILITYGAGHKGWFLRQLKKRDDITLLDFAEVVGP